ncbi:pyrroloquinoline quinone biosynthesis protein PqqB [Cupriavidus alkaliphilus]|uniref:pyrroloquinoline quinone biosynthesis protein PqqB n=1 Tax=Cupriavidus alkaliphilus TaxID=942866 RepID=UPI0016200DE7|nr:pyrroloquinoline quinone biosynthesis protein PqqB [Cupriavidus alkaliphilus]MBB3015167.1 pyrroloquinoline quinone biosynthesis protein B [Cupriavidus alkaliphilus]
MTTIRVLGSAAGGGFPQWNCNCRNCDGVRRGTVRATPRTQSSIALCGDGPDAIPDAILVNASPDILQQLRQTPALQPARAGRDTAIAAVLLMDAQIDHVTGLLMLREHRRALPLYASASVLDDLAGAFPLTRILSHYCGLECHALPCDGTAFSVPPLDGVALTAVPLQSKAPPYSPRRHAPQPGDNIGLRIEDRRSGRSAFYAPGLGQVDDHVFAQLRRADVVLVDGTFWRDDEMQALGYSARSAADMGHLALSGPGGMIEVLDRLPARRKILIHINNTNPVLAEDSPEHAELARHGIELAYDGMEIAL